MAKERSTLSMSAYPPPPKAEEGDERAVLVQVYPPGKNLGRRFSLAGRSEHVIGRLEEVEIPIEEEAVSRRHARIYLEGGVWTLEDLSSMNGSYVNDERVERQLLRDGDKLRFGMAILKFLAGSNIEAAYHEEIYRMSIVDNLTGVHNKRYLLEFLEREIARSVRYTTPLSLVMFDIDHFKKVNDLHGHLAGDGVLRDLGRRLRPRMRREDLLARYGGEEFACVLANTTSENALKMGEDLRALVSDQPFTYEGTELVVTISLGVAELLESERLPDELIRRADQKLYAAKRSGRNRVAG